MSTNTGLALVSTTTGLSPSILHTEEVTFKKLTGWPRVNAIAGRIMDAHAEHKPDFITIEDYAVSKFGGAAICSIEIGSIVRFLLWQEGIPFLDVSPTSLKKFLTGKGNAPKDVMMMHVFKKFGYTSKSNDVADAIALGMFGLCAAGVRFNAEATLCVQTVLKGRKEGLPLPQVKTSKIVCN